MSSQRSWEDAVAPPLAFVLINLLLGDIWAASAGAVGLSVILATIRLLRRNPPRYALGDSMGSSHLARGCRPMPAPV